MAGSGGRGKSKRPEKRTARRRRTDAAGPS